jgi:peptidoglycan/xylan/chitin deacetylase (PgdA/CDA1 family)
VARRSVAHGGRLGSALASVSGARAGAVVKRLVKTSLRARPIGDAIRAVAAARGRSLVLVYHRVTAAEPPTHEVVPTVTPMQFRRQLEVIADVGDIVPLDEILGDRDRHSKPRFAITLDDDFATHVEGAFPALIGLGAPATFFLSGRSLHGLGPYWFEQLERLVAERGIETVARVVGVATDRIEDLILACERDPALQARLEVKSPHAPRHLGRHEIQALSDAGMSIGFHTLRHKVLVRLDDQEVVAALTVGRKEIEDVIGRPLVHFAYPHGQADRRTADKAKEAGYEAAWTGRPHAMRRDDDRYLLGRWEPGALDVDDFLVGTAIRLTR